MRKMSGTPLLPKDDSTQVPHFRFRVWTVIRDIAMLGIAGTALYLVWDMNSSVNMTSSEIHQHLKNVNITTAVTCIEKICRVI